MKTEEKQSQPKQWYHRGYLPHFDDGIMPQFITMRLFDSLPQEVLEKWRSELMNAENGEIVLRRNIERYLDSGYGSCFFKNNQIAEMMQKSLLFQNERKYGLISWAIMPNHVHLLITRYEGFSLEEILHSIKSYTAHEANRILKRTGAFWQRESYDRFIRNEEHFANVIRYIEQNPVKAKLCERSDDWIYGSAYYRKQKSF